MHVKNQEEMIWRSLESVKNVIDCISICDTGSTDNTIEIIEQFMKETGIPGKVYKTEGKDLRDNGTALVQEAQKTLQGLGFSLSHSYLLTLDAGMVLKASAAFMKDLLEMDAYLILEKSSLLSYYNYSAHLLRASLPWESSGVMQTAWSNKEQHRSRKLYSLVIESQEDKDQYTDRLKQDMRDLKQGIKDEPDNARYLFLLAQASKCLKHYDEALRWYRARIEKGGDKEEIWFSKYMIGTCFEEMGEWDHALYWYLEAYQFYPSRPDSLQKVATHYRLEGQNDLAYIFAKHGSRIPVPTDQTLFSSSPFDDYKFDEELSIAAYYTHFKDEGFVAANDLAFRKNAPWYVKDQAYKNMQYYVKNLKNARFQPISIELPLVTEGLSHRYNPMNPSIQKTESGYKLICRTVNYTQTGAKVFNTVDPSGIFRTKNFLVWYDLDFKKYAQQEIRENLSRERIDSWLAANIVGQDDCRIFEMGNCSWFTCTTSDTNPTGNFQISLCKLPEKKIGDIVNIQKLVPLKGPDLNRCEKNWLPFIKNGELSLIYSYDPFTIYKPNVETGECEMVLSYEPQYDFSRFRGSAAPIEFDDGYLMLVHEVIVLPDYERRYIHRFLYLDKNFLIQQVSLPFTFLHLGIEFCCSMILDHSGKQLVIPIGVEDREAYLCFMDVETVRSLLVPLPQQSIQEGKN